VKFGSDSSDNDDDSYEGYDDVEPIDEAIKMELQAKKFKVHHQN
jgi:hypothetical protein